MRRMVLILLAACAVFIPLVPASGDPVMEPVSYHFDFENGSVGAWSSYPPSQDTAYDPTIWVKPIYVEQNEKNRALYREITPNYEIDTMFGVVKINGRCESQWQFSAPRVHKLDEWPEFIAGAHFKEGDTITIFGNPPFNAGSVAVVLSRAFTGEDVKTLRMKKKGDNWSLSISLTAKNGIESGIWQATVKASSKDRKNDTISTDLVFLVKCANAPGGNPRLLMKPGDAPKIREKASSGRMREILDSLTAEAKRSRGTRDVNNFRYNLGAYDQIYWLPTYDGYIQAISVPSSFIRSNGVVYGITGDTEAGDAAKNALLMMAKWPSFVHPHILNQGQFTYWPVGQKLTDLAIGFDMAADRFTASERREVAQALYSKGITEVFKEYVRDNRVLSCTSNWIGDVTAGGILCALAVMDDYGDEELEPYLTGMLLKLDSKPGRIVINGEKVIDWTYDKQQVLTIMLGAGSGTVEIQ